MLPFNAIYLPTIVRDAVEYIIADCKKSGFKVSFKESGKVVQGSASYSGFFDYEKNRLVVEKSSDWNEWVNTLIHEYCHFLQYREQSKIWKEAEKNYAFPYWLDGMIDLSRQVLRKHFTAMRNLELDCELRVLKFMKKHKLPLSVNKQKQWLNYHMCALTMVMKTRKWMKGKALKLINSLPKNRVMSKLEFNNPPRLFQELFLKHNKSTVLY